MYKVAAAFVTIALLGAVYGDISFTGNVSFSGTAHDWQYRKTTLGHIFNTGWYSSLDIHRVGNTFLGDLIIGGLTAGPLVYPALFLAYYTANVSVGLDASIFSMDVSTTANYIANAYLEVVEKDASGNIVYTLDLNNGNGFFEPILWTVGDTKLDGDLKYIVLNGVRGSYSISLTVIVSDVAGVVSLAGAVVTPKVLETIIQINNWPYKAPTNTLTLVAVAATGAGSSHNDLIVSGSGANQVYYQLNDTVIVSGTKRSVTISSSTVVVDHLKNSDLVSSVTGKFGESAAVQLYNITFPAGAEAITYDPTLGSGATIQQQQNAAVTTAASLLLAVIFAIALLM